MQKEKKKPGPKTFICSICKTEVTRRDSYAIDEGKRACRSHAGVTDYVNQGRKNEEKKKVENLMDNRLQAQVERRGFRKAAWNSPAHIALSREFVSNLQEKTREELKSYINYVKKRYPKKPVMVIAKDIMKKYGYKLNEASYITTAWNLYLL